MVGVFKGTAPLSSAYKGTTPAREIYVGTTKVWPTTSLLSYSEMVDLGNNDIYDAVNELNAHPQEYYNKYISDGHLYDDSGNSGYMGLGIDNTGFYVFTEEGVMDYDTAMDLFGEYRILVYDYADGTGRYETIVGTEFSPM